MLVAKLSAVTALISCAEFLAAPGILKDSGLMSWEVSSLRQAWLIKPPAAPALNAALRYPNVLGLVALRAMLAIAILAGTGAVAVNPWILCLQSILTGLLTVRSLYGQDGADQMNWITFSALALASLHPTSQVLTACLWFLGLQACLAYGTAGIAKATARQWWTGEFLPLVLGTRMYGNVGFARFLYGNPHIARALSISIVLWESLFPIILILPAQAALALLVTAVLFHLLNAVIMGLNTFFWAFVATYPAVLYCVQHRPW